MIKKLLHNALTLLAGLTIGYSIMEFKVALSLGESVLSFIVNKATGDILLSLTGNQKLNDYIFIAIYHLIIFSPFLIFCAVVSSIIICKIEKKRLFAYSILTWPIFLLVSRFIIVEYLRSYNKKNSYILAQLLSVRAADVSFEIFLIYSYFFTYMTLSYKLFNRIMNRPNKLISLDKSSDQPDGTKAAEIRKKFTGLKRH